MKGKTHLSCFWISVLLVLSMPLMAAGTLSSATYHQLESIHEMIDQGEYQQAEKQLTILQNKNQNDYTQALLLQTMAHVHINQNQYSLAIEQLNKAYQLDALPRYVMLSILYNLAQLYAQEGDQQKSISFLTTWLKEQKSLTAEQHAFAATIFAQVTQYDKAIKHMLKALKKNRISNKNWIENLAIFYQLNNQPDLAIPYYETLCAIDSANLKYWRHLAELQLNADQAKAALASFSLANTKGLLAKESDILFLSSLYYYADIPYQAANLMQQGLKTKIIQNTAKNSERLAQYWLAAKEYKRAIESLHQVLSIPPVRFGPLLQMAKLQIELNQWAEAKTSLMTMLKIQFKPEQVDIKGEGWYLLGIVNYYLKSNSASVAAFHEAQQIPKYKMQASTWLQFLQEDL